MTESKTDPKKALSRRFMDAGMVKWEAYVSGGQPDTAAAARIYFVCLEDPFERPRWLPHESRSVAAATRDLAALSDDDLVAMLDMSEALD
ncbi:MAG: hypothetical protein MJB57_05450 [Gemmatimonadetes bacterium]|nr:hypothetical protein [Gemmatimonadota bacterium]